MFTTHDQLGEDGGEPAVAGRVADVLLVSVVVRGVDDELARVGVVGGGGAQLLDVRAVAGLGHGKAAGDLEGGRGAQVALVVAFGAELLDRAAPQAELDAELDQQRQIAERDRLKAGHVGAGVAAPAVALGEAGRGQAAGGEGFRPGEDALPVVGGRQGGDRRELRLGEHRAQLLADVGVAAVQQALQRGWIKADVRRADRRHRPPSICPGWGGTRRLDSAPTGAGAGRAGGAGRTCRSRCDARRPAR